MCLITLTISRSTIAPAHHRLFLVGFCVLVVPGTILQLIIAFVFSLLCMLLTAVAMPFASDVDDTIGKVDLTLTLNPKP